jgi:hypothetical protein
MTLPDELRHRATHRIPDRDERVDPECIGDGDGVVSTVFEPERPTRAQPAPVTAMVEGNHPPMLRQLGVTREEIEVGGRRPTVQQNERRSPGRTGDVANEQRPELGELDLDALWQRRSAQNNSASDRLDVEHGHPQLAVGCLVRDLLTG